MDSFSRRTIAVSAAILLSSPAASFAKSTSRRRTVSSRNQLARKQRKQRQRAPAKPARPEPIQHPEETPLTATFSCGSIWTEATQCSQLCVANDGCPDGQQCYAGIPCPRDMVGEKQRDLEQAEMDAHMEMMKREYVNRFVCGESYDNAVLSCGGGSAINSLSFLAESSSSMTTNFCPSGSSGQCPSGMECYAAVSCPRGSVEEEDELVIYTLDSDRLRSLSSLVTDPILYNATAVDADGFFTASSSMSMVASIFAWSL